MALDIHPLQTSGEFIFQGQTPWLWEVIISRYQCCEKHIYLVDYTPKLFFRLLIPSPEMFYQGAWSVSNSASCNCHLYTLHTLAHRLASCLISFHGHSIQWGDLFR